MTAPIGAGPLHHVGVVVASVREAASFYTDVLGYAAEPAQDVPEQHVAVVFVTRGNSRIELLEPTDATSGIARFLAERGRSTMHHLCFEVDDLTRTLDRLAAEGVELIDRTPRRGVHGQVAFVHPRATSGVLVELLEPAR